jgi:hypothetical protein
LQALAEQLEVERAFTQRRVMKKELDFYWMGLRVGFCIPLCLLPA